MVILRTTNRLNLRYFEPKDTDIFFGYRNDPQLTEFQSWPIPFTSKMLQVFFKEISVQTIHSRDKWVQIVLEHRYTKEMIGDVAFCNKSPTVELGITLRKEYHGMGFGNEAMKGLMALLISEQRVHRFIAIIDPDNIASISLFEGLGFRKEGHYIKSYWDEKKHEWRNEFLYALLTSEFHE